jgi:TPP-dependent pyruvate/acetoin dehydrogenase alpha subunit
MTISNTVIPELYTTMRRIRTFEERVSELFIKGESAGTMLHLSIGEEIGAACVGKAMDKNDTFTTHHRGHGIFIARGGNPNKMLAEIAGKKDGYCKGKGGSMHIADMNLGHLGANAIVGGGIPTVVGAALSYKYLKQDRVSVAFFGDGAMQQGILYESMNMAALWNLPVVFCCINNQYGMGTKVDDAVGIKEFSKRAKSFGLNTLHINDLDVENAYHKSKNLIDLARKGQPGFIEIECYRFFGHARMDKSPYRSDEEENEMRKRDPILYASTEMIKNKILDESDIKTIDKKIFIEMDEAMDFAINSPLNNEDEIFKDVYSVNDSLPISVDERINKILSI